MEEASCFRQFAAVKQTIVIKPFASLSEERSDPVARAAEFKPGRDGHLLPDFLTGDLNHVRRIVAFRKTCLQQI